MRSFANLFTALDETTKTLEKVAALVRYFAAVSPAEAAWALYFLSGRRLRQPIPSARLRQFAIEQARIPPWLFAECYDAVGDLAETIVLLIPETDADSERPLDEWVHDWLVPLRESSESEQRARLHEAWSQLSPEQTFVWNKLLTGSFRVGVSQQLVVRALALVSGLQAATVAHRLMGEWSPTATFFSRLLDANVAEDQASKPYPFFLAHPLEADPATLGDLAQWQIEWKWDGIRCQLIKRRGELFLWSRGEDLLTDRFPEIPNLHRTLPDGVVLDGEILPFKNDRPLTFLDLQQRITRKSLSKKLLADVPVQFMAYDLLEDQGVDLRPAPLRQRRQQLETLTATHTALRLSPLLAAASWPALDALRQESRQRGVEGLMLKRLDSPYRVGRQRGDWWKWKIQPYTLDAVLLYAQAGHGKRSSLYTDYTFGLWDQGQLVPFAKAYSGLTDEEIQQVDAFVRRNTTEKFGPVRTVKPQLVFELAFESIQLSARHRSGIAVRFPRMHRWRLDKRPEDADTLETARRMIDSAPPRASTKPSRTKPTPATPLFDNLPEETDAAK